MSISPKKNVTLENEPRLKEIAVAVRILSGCEPIRTLHTLIRLTESNYRRYLRKAEDGLQLLDTKLESGADAATLLRIRERVDWYRAAITELTGYYDEIANWALKKYPSEKNGTVHE